MNVKQHTIQKTVSITGIGLHTGEKVTMLLQPAAIVGVRWGATVGALIAMYTLVDAYGVKTLAIAPVLFDCATCVTKTIMMIPHVARNPKQARQAVKGYWHLAWAIGLLSPLGYILVLYALRNGAAVSLVAPAREMSMLLVTMAGLYFLREAVGWGRLAGCCAIAAGVVLLAGG